MVTGGIDPLGALRILRRSVAVTMTKRYALVGLLVGSAAAGTAESAAASDMDCRRPSNPVYVSGGSAAEPHLLALASVLGTSVSIIYATPTACIGLQDVTTPGQTEGPRSSTWTRRPRPLREDVPDVHGNRVSAVLCRRRRLGRVPVLVHLAADQPRYDVSGFPGADRGLRGRRAVGLQSELDQRRRGLCRLRLGRRGQYAVTPWTVPANVYTRGQTSAVQLVIADSIGLLGSKWLTNTGDAGLAQVIGSESTMVTTLQSATNYNATIGILGSGALDPVKFAPTTSDAGVTTGGLKPLAYQDTNQTPPQDCGYYADSDVAHFDKINVRQGRYGILGARALRGRRRRER